MTKTDAREVRLQRRQQFSPLLTKTAEMISGCMRGDPFWSFAEIAGLQFFKRTNKPKTSTSKPATQ